MSDYTHDYADYMIKFGELELEWSKIWENYQETYLRPVNSGLIPRSAQVEKDFKTKVCALTERLKLIGGCYGYQNH